MSLFGAKKVEVGEIRAVVVFSDDPRRLADWYSTAFESKEFLSTPDFIGMSLGSVSLFVQRTSEGHRPGTGGIRPHFTVKDCPPAFARLVELGAKPLLNPYDAGAEWVAAVQDPDGNPLGLLTPKGRR
ncbi:MAG TPA: VOC family protein [Myxococcales bacterium]